MEIAIAFITNERDKLGALSASDDQEAVTFATNFCIEKAKGALGTPLIILLLLRLISLLLLHELLLLHRGGCLNESD